MRRKMSALLRIVGPLLLLARMTLSRMTVMAVLVGCHVAVRVLALSVMAIAHVANYGRIPRTDNRLGTIQRIQSATARPVQSVPVRGRRRRLIIADPNPKPILRNSNMRGKIHARIPRDNGRVLRFGAGQTMTVGPETCEACQQSITSGVVLQGETDSFGWEPVVLCDACHQAAHKDDEAYVKALDVEDRRPKEGHLFLVAGCTNYDGHGSWCATFDSLRKATGYLRGIHKQAEPWGGLYPETANQVQELVREDALRRVRTHREAEQAERDALDASLAREEAQERDYYE